MAGVVVALVIFIISQAVKADNFNKKVREMDNDPNCSLKTDEWRAEHPEWKGGYKL